MTTLYIDADACPVKPEAERVATRLRLPMVLVCNGGLRPSQNPYVSLMIVPEGPDVADQWIAAHCGPGDVVVTGDLPLADRCLKAGARVLDPRGRLFSAESIGSALASREISAFLRDMGEMGTGPKPFSDRDRSAFLNALENQIQALLKAARGRGGA